jgi:hypothetical protein
VVVPPGAGALVSTNSVDGTVLLVTEPGIAYPVPPAAMSALGYSGVVPVPLPAALLGRIPLGPALDPVAAALPVAS